MLAKISRIIFMFLITTAIIYAQYGKKIERTGGIARVMSMGNNPYIIDPYFVILNPAWGAKYSNYLQGEIGSSNGNDFGTGGNGQFFSANFKLNRHMTLGGYLVRNDFYGLSIAKLDPFNIVQQINAQGGSIPVIPLDNNFVVFATFSSGSHYLGVSVAYAATNSEENLANGQQRTGSASQFGIQGGYMGVLSRSIRLEVSAFMIFPVATREAPNVSDTKFSQTLLGLNSRLFITASKRLTLVPIFSLFSSSGSADIGDANGTTSTDLPSNKVIRAGLGFVFTLGDFLFAGGPSFESSSTTSPAIPGSDPERKSSNFSFPAWNIGAEWMMLDWLAARIGYSVSTLRQTTETTASLTEVDERIVTIFDPANGGITVGVGFRLGDFSLDATVNEDVLRQGLNNLGGGGATFAYISAAYAF